MKYKKVITKNSKELKIIYRLLKDLDIRYRFFWKRFNMAMGQAKVRENKIEIFIHIPNKVLRQYPLKVSVRKQTKQEFFSTVFHEIGHIISARQGLYLNYNRGLFIEEADQKMFNKWAKEALLAERHCDKLGKAMMKAVFPKTPYIGWYYGKQGRTFIKTFIEHVAYSHGFKLPT